jgi:hypothetical protein
MVLAVFWRAFRPKGSAAPALEVPLKEILGATGYLIGDVASEDR